MNEAFNPYREWLGLELQTNQPDFYELLGLDRFEQDVEKIRVAADRAAAAVRGFRPGAQARAWASLLDQLKDAKSCLADATRKAAYDEALRQEASRAASSPSAESDSDNPDGPEIALVNQDANLYPPGMAPPNAVLPASSATSKKTDTRAAGPKRNAAASRVETEPKPSTIRAAVRPAKPPADVETSSPQKDLPQKAPESNQPQRARPIPSNVPPGMGLTEKKTVAPVSEQPLERVSLALDDSIPEREPVNAHFAPPVDERPSQLPWIIGIAVAIILLTLAILYVALFTDRVSDTSPSGPKSSPAPKLIAQAPSARPTQSPQLPTPKSGVLTAPARSPLVAAPKPGRQPGRQNVIPQGTRPTSPVISPDSPSKPGAQEVEPKDSGSADTDTSVDSRTVEPKQSQPDFPAPNPPASSGEGNNPPRKPANDDPSFDPDSPFAPDPDDQPTEPQPTQTDIAQLREALVRAKAMVTQRDFDSARLELDKAKLHAKMLEHQDMVRRLDMTADNCQKLWDAVLRGTRSLQGAEELSIADGKLIVIVVEAGRDWLVIRRAGRNVRYSLNNMPAGLAFAIADRSLQSNAPKTLVMKGAWLATDANATPEYLAKARSYWLQAQDAGVDIHDLPKVLDDRYNFGRAQGANGAFRR